MSAGCLHEAAVPEVCDQTLGVSCKACGGQWACWMDDHVPEDVWNRACPNGEGFVPCEQSRPGVCAICGEDIGASE